MTKTKPLADIITGEEATCVQCRAHIVAIIDPYSGVVDWGAPFGGDKTMLDFGCDRSPLSGDEGCGGHNPGSGHTPLGFKTRPS